MARRNTIWSLQDLALELDQQRAKHKRIVQCHGIFDLLHVGHIRYFEQAKMMGDLLVVTVTPDRFVQQSTGRPTLPQHIRSEVLAALDCVDYVAIDCSPTAVESIKILRPHVFAKGTEVASDKDVSEQHAAEEEAIRSIGGELAFAQDLNYRSPLLLNDYMASYSPEAHEYLSRLVKRYSTEQILAPLQNAAPLKVLCIGETIIDEYQYCEVIGKSGKEPLLAARYIETEKFAGGVLACANHVASFCNRVDVLTFLGEGGDQEAFVRSALKPNVHPMFVYQREAPTIVKRRFVEKYLAQKLFEVYYMNDDSLPTQEDELFCSMLKEILPNYDVVIVTDYGHGMLSSKAVEVLTTYSRFLAVNTQSNAGNNGFHAISKYPRADFVCLAYREYAIETRNRHMWHEDMILHVARKLSCSNLILTQGKYGCLAYSHNEGFIQIPAFATKIVDRVGAGDAVFSLAALGVVQGVPTEIIGFLGNVIGAEAVAIMGNKRAIERVPLFRHVECLLQMHHGADSDDQQETIRFAA